MGQQFRELLGLFICVCIALCTIVAHSIAQNKPDNFPSYPPDNHRAPIVSIWGKGRLTKAKVTWYVKQCKLNNKQLITYAFHKTF